MRFLLSWVIANAIFTATGVLAAFGGAMLAYAAASRLGIFGIVFGAALYPIAGFVLGAVAAAGQYLILRGHLSIAGIRWVTKSGAASALLLIPAFIAGSYILAPIAYLFPDALRAPLAGRLLVGLHFSATGAVMGAGLGWAQRAELHRAGLHVPRWTIVNAIAAAIGCAFVLGATAFAPEGALGRGISALIRSAPIFALVGATAAVITGTHLVRGLFTRKNGEVIS